MKTFKEWMKIKEAEAIVTCKDRDNPNFQIWGALSDLNCPKKNKKSKIEKHKKQS